MFLAAAIPAVFYAVLALRLPESPRMLIANGDVEEATAVWEHVHGRGESESKTLVDSIRKSIRSDSKPSFRDLKGGTLRLVPILWVGVIIAAFQQLVGINVIFYYSNSLWRSVGFSAKFASNASVITAVTNLVVTMVAIVLIDKLGRRPLLLIVSSGMTISLALMAISFSQASIVNGEPQLPEPWGTVALVAANWFVVFYALASLVLVYFKVPETRNLPLEEMADRYKRERRNADKTTA